ncbi:hypothetical protein Tco_1570081 [Tanacetum coccineum]
MDSMQQPMPNPEDITDPTTTMNMTLALMAKAFQLNYSTPTNSNQRISSNPRNRQIAQPGNHNGYNAVQNIGNQNANQIRNGDLDEIEEVNANCILMANLQQASTLGTQTDKAPVYNSDGSAEVHNYNNCYDDEIFNMFTQEEHVEQNRGTVEQSPSTIEETSASYDSLYNNLSIEVEKVNLVNRKMKATNAELTTELARYKNQEKCFEISQKKYDKLERCYQKSVYQEQCLTKKINALYLSSGKQIMTLNEEISNLNKQISKEKSTVSSLLEEKKRLKSDFKICEDELLDKQIQLENKIKELDNLLVKTAQQKQQSLYNGKVLLGKHDPPVVYDSEETLQLAQESLFKDISDIGSLRADDHEYLELSGMPEDPYIEAALQAPPSRDYVPGPEEPKQAPPSPDYVPGPKHTNDEIINEDQADRSEDDDEDPEEDPVDYPADGGDDEDDEDDEEGSSKDDEDDDMDIEADDEVEEEHLAPADFVVVSLPATNQAPSAEETEHFETDESAATPPPYPAYRVASRISILAPVPTPLWSDAEVARLFFLLSTPTSSPLSPCTPPCLIHFIGLSSCYDSDESEAILLHILYHSTTLLYSPTRPDCSISIALGLGYEVGKSSSAATTRPARGLRADYGFIATMDREIRRDPEREVGYRITDSWDEIVETLQGAPVSTDTELGRHVTAFETKVRQDTGEVYTRDRRAHAYTRHQMETEARLSQKAWRRSMDASDLARREETDYDFRDAEGRLEEICRDERVEDS